MTNRILSQNRCGLPAWSVHFTHNDLKESAPVVAKLIMPVGMAGEQVIKLLAEKRRLIGDHSTVQ
jgi:hypothetical protein